MVAIIEGVTELLSEMVCF